MVDWEASEAVAEAETRKPPSFTGAPRGFAAYGLAGRDSVRRVAHPSVKESELLHTTSIQQTAF